MTKKITHRVIAREAGVSIFTVSMALRNRLEISPEVRHRVQEVARRLGYRRDPRLSELMAATRRYSAPSSYQSTLAYLDTATDSQRDLYAFKAYRQGTQRQAEKYGYFLDYFRLDDFMARPKAVERVMAAKNIRGLILFWPHAETIPKVYDRIFATNACICLAAGPKDAHIDCVLSDHFRVGTLAVEKALAAGCRRLGLVLEPWLDSTSGFRFSGGFATRNRSGPGNQSIPPCAIGHDQEMEIFFKWYRRHRPDCIITMHYFIREWLLSAGVDIPGDVSLIHWDVNPDTSREWAGVEQEPYLISAVAVDLVVGQLHRQAIGPSAPKKMTMVDPGWRDGPSFRSVRA